MTASVIAGPRLADLAWPQVPQGATILLPVGSLEQHGPHLPLDTDTVIAASAAQAVAEKLTAIDPNVLVAPALPFGASGEHQEFAGTVSIGHIALADVLREMIRSLSTWAERIVVVNGHGGNVPTLITVINQMRYENHDVAWIPCLFEASQDAHAGHDETSVMLHLNADRVRMERAARGNTGSLESLLPLLMASGVRAASPLGVLGDPTEASAAHGKRIFAAAIEQSVALISHGTPSETGRLVPQLVRNEP